MSIIRDFLEVRSALAIANADIPVLVVLRLGDEDRRRALDVLAGWAIGSHGSVDHISAHVLVLRSVAAPLAHLNRQGLVSAVDAAFVTVAEAPLTRSEESRLLPLARAGSVEARRRLIDAYTEVTTVIALWLRPEHVAVETATRWAHEELDNVVTEGRPRPLLVELVDRVATRFGS